VPSVGEISEAFEEDKSDYLKKIIYDYFGQSTIACPSSWKMVNPIWKRSYLTLLHLLFFSQDVPAADLDREDLIRRDIERFLLSHDDPGITGRTIAKIFQGISSPCFPAIDWGRNKAFWRRYLDVDFHFITRLASEEIVRFRWFPNSNRYTTTCILFYISIINSTLIKSSNFSSYKLNIYKSAYARP